VPAGAGTDMITCPACGRRTSPTSRNCPECGAPLPEPSGLDRTLAVGGDRTLGTHPSSDAAPAHTEDDGTLLPSDVPGSQAGAPPPGEGEPLVIGQMFGDRYRITRLLGIGGMGAVYEAFDEKVGTRVALKVVRLQGPENHELTLQLDRRFKRELLLARQVTHKNVVRIHDLGEIDGIKYITMSYVEGESLAQVLDRRGHLPVSEALPIMRGILSGLVEAHQVGVVHRDLKPANIMVEADTGTPLIMDFGIARSAGAPDGEEMARRVDRSSAAPDEGHHHHETRAGDVVGTLQYMPPEQFYGRGVDQRADIYALGLMLYDMLVGRHHRGEGTDSAFAELRRRLEGSPPSPRTIDPSIPETLDRIIMRCLEPDPDDRYATSAELAAEIDALDDEGRPRPVERKITRRVIAAAMFAVAAAIVGTWWIASHRVPPAQHEPMSVLIADLDNETGDASFEGAVEQGLTIALEGAPFISAYPRPSALKTARKLEPDSHLDETMARLVSRREGLSAIITSRLSPEGEGYVLHVSALDPGLDPGEGKPLASATASARDRNAVLAAVAQAASEIRRDLGDTTPAADRLAASETFTAASLDAMRDYARGQDLAAQGKFEEALAAYEEAVKADPAFGRAWAGMAVVHGNLRQTDAAEADFQRALQNLDRMSERERYRTLGGYYLLVSRNYDKAIENYSKLIELYPADRAAYTNLSFAYLNTRNFAKAMEVGRQAVSIEPSSVIKRMNYAMYAMYAGDFPTAMQESRTVLEQNPSFGYALLTLGRAAEASGDLAAAREAFNRLSASEGLGASLGSLATADLEMYLGRPKRALEILEPAVAAAKSAGNAFDEAAKRIALAEAEVALGEPSKAIEEAHRAVKISQHESVLFPAARVLLACDRPKDAEAIATQLENLLQSQSTAEAALIRGEIALREKRLPEAIRFLRQGRQQYDFWFARYLMGRAYFEAAHYPEALDELQACVDRKGEIADVFLVDGATLRYFPPALYWLARTKEALGERDGARDLYRQYVELRRGADPADPLAADAATRAGGS